MTLLDKSTSIFDLEKGSTKDLHLESTPSFQIHGRGADQQQHQRSLLETKNLARMHSRDWETNDLKFRKASCLHSSFIPEILEHTRTLSKTGEIEPVVREQWMAAREQ